MNIPEAVRQQAAALYGIDPEAMPLLGGMDGVVYACQYDRQDLALKITPLAADEVEEKVAKAEALHHFITYLIAHEVPIAKPWPSLEGHVMETVADDQQVYLISCAERAPGHHVQARFMNEWNETLFENWGRIMGRMHALTIQFEQEQGRLALSDWQQEVAQFTEWCTDTPVRQHWRQIQEALSGFETPPEAFGLIHNDLHPHNFLVDGERITVIDFDVCNYHWFATDIAIPVFHALGMRLPTKYESPEAFALRFLKHFMAGYRQEHTLPTEWLLRLPGFIDYRRILLYTVFSNEWSGTRTPWQKKTLYDWRREILNNQRVVDLRPDDLLRV